MPFMPAAHSAKHRVFPRVYGLQTRVLLLIGFLFAMVLLIAFHQAYQRRDADLRTALRDLQDRTDEVARRQAERIAHLSQVLSLTARIVEFNRLAEDSRCAETLTSILRSDHTLASVSITDLTGKLVCGTANDAKAANVRDRPYFQRALESGESVVGDATIGRLSGRWIFPMAKRLVDAEGHPRGLLIVGMDMDWINREFERLGGNGPARLGLVREDGVVLARYPEPELWVGRDISAHRAYARMLAMQGHGTLEETSHDGERRIYAFSPFAQTVTQSMYLWMNVPLSSVTEQANREFWNMLTVALMLALLTAGLAVWGSHILIVRPLSAVTNAAQQLAAGNPLSRTGLPPRRDEIGQLAEVFDEMATRLTQFDPLTGLPNRASFELAIEAAIALNTPGFAVIRLSIENVSYVEGNFGPQAGRDFIVFLARRISGALADQAICARLEESNFGLLLESCRTLEQARRLAGQLEEFLGALAFETSGTQIYPEFRLGVCLHPADGLSATELMQHAGVALTHPDRDVGARLHFFEPGMNERLRRRIQLTNQLRVALRDDQLELHYQPQMDLTCGCIVGVEALVRWQHPSLGYVSPAEFIPIAEESGLIQDLGIWVTRQAVLQRLRWREQGLLGDDVRVAINVSPLQLLGSGLDTALEQLLKQTGLPAVCVELELTESHLLSSEQDVCEQLGRFNLLGVQVAIDDFGTGYSSLAYLKQYAIDKLKIDKSFIDHVTSDPDDQAIVRATVAMAHELGLLVIAEGVETSAQVDYLRSIGCDQIQGYYFCRPLPAVALEPFLARNRMNPG